MRLEFTVPVKATFTLNSRLHWFVRSRKRKAERNATALAYLSALTRSRGNRWRGAMHMPPLPPWTVTLTRIGPRKLDSDNVQGALKAIRDEVAAQLGIDDGDPRITWNYAQEKGDYAVRVLIQTADSERGAA